MSGVLSRFVLSDQVRYRFVRHFSFWLFWWVFQGFMYGSHYIEIGGPKALIISFGDALIFLLQHMFLSYGLMYYAVPQIMKDRYLGGLVITGCLIIIAAFLSPLLTRTLIKLFRDFIESPGKDATIFYLFMGGLRGSLTVAGFAVSIKLLKYWYVNKIEKQRLQKENAEARLQALQGQLQPHFMFNTLNSIYSLSLKQSSQTSDAILRLSQLMRYMLVECNNLTIPLSREISMLTDYIELEKTRLGDRLEMSVNIEGDIEGQNIPPLLLLPYLENSFKYGAHESVAQAWVSFDLLVHDHEMRFKLINGKPMNGTAKPESFHVGLENTSKRLNLLYPDAHELHLIEDEDSFIVSLNIQLKRIKIPA
jgi:hypothetical protein